MQPEKSKEKRITPRIHIPVYIETFAESFPLGILVNISTKGMFVQSTEPKEVGTQMDLRFQLPETSQSIQAAAEVIWVNYPPSFPENENFSQPGRPVYDNPGMGLRILSIDPKSRMLLDEFIHGMKETGKGS